MPNNYQLLKDTFEVVSRLEEKMDKRIESVENRTQIVETKLDQMIGKIGIGVMIGTLFISTIITLVVDGIKRQLWK